MKKFFVLLLLTLISGSIFCQVAVDSASTGGGTEDGFVYQLIGIIISIVVLLGQFVLKGKWYAVGQWLIKVLQILQEVIRAIPNRNSKGEFESSVKDYFKKKGENK